MSLPPDQIVYASADGPTIQQLLDHVLAFLAGVFDRAWGALAIVAKVLRLQAVDINRRTAFEAPRESQGVGIRAERAVHNETKGCLFFIAPQGLYMLTRATSGSHEQSPRRFQRTHFLAPLSRPGER